jgi:DNA-binding transcriptional regulator YdaS (Cro superfamily)
MFQGKSVKKAVLASAVAGLFLAGANAALAAEGATEGKVKCEGVNSCKGHGECKSAKHSCAGKNACSGQGFVMMSQADCDAAKAKKAAETK